MKVMNFRPSSCKNVILAALIILTLGVSAIAGTFTDRDGTIHQWSVNSSHALAWEGVPYLPFGVVFDPAYLSSGQTDENWAADEAYVKSLAASGITDVLIKPAPGISAAPVSAFQRIIDLLEANNLKYGVVLNNPPYQPLTGYIIQPTVNRVEGIKTSGDVTRAFPDSKSAIWALVGANTGDIKNVGEALAVDGRVTVNVALKDNDPSLLLFFPQKTVSPKGSVGMPDIWSDFDKHRDYLLSFLAKLRFGSGLRFFCDPFSESFGMSGETADLIPTSKAFRNEYAAWLSKKYNSAADLEVAWGISRNSISDFDSAAKLIPLWRNTRGIAAVYHDGLDKRYKVDTVKSRIWVDFQEFQSQSIKAYMNVMADVLKRKVADVPVVYTANGLKPFYLADNAFGFESLAVPVNSVETLTVRAGRVLSLADGSSKPTWIVANLNASEPAYRKRDEFFNGLNTLRYLGAKAFFVDTHSAGFGDNGPVSWLSDYASVSRNDKRFASYRAAAVYYPEGTSNAKIKRLSNGAWWLPALRSGMNMRLGSTLGGYTILDPDGNSATQYIWSLRGNRTIHLASDGEVTVTDSNGDASKRIPIKGRVEIVVGEDPLLISGISSEQMVPLETVQEAILNLKRLMDAAELKRMSTAEYNINIVRAMEMVEQNRFSMALDMIESSIDELAQRLKGLESEQLVNPSISAGAGR